MTALRVLVDQVPLPDDEARPFWRRFSAWMEEHPGDLAGFAASEGLASVHPEVHDGHPVLVASRTAAQRPYAPAPTRARASPTGQAQGRSEGGKNRKRPRGR